jgi:hypothetical protein
MDLDQVTRFLVGLGGLITASTGLLQAVRGRRAKPSQDASPRNGLASREPGASPPTSHRRPRRAALVLIVVGLVFVAIFFGWDSLKELRRNETMQHAAGLRYARSWVAADGSSAKVQDVSSCLAVAGFTWSSVEIPDRRWTPFSDCMREHGYHVPLLAPDRPK